MGLNHSHRVFSEDELDAYRDLTYLSTHEILHAFNVFASLDPQMTRSIIQDHENTVLPKNIILTLPQLRANPFKHRILSVCIWWNLQSMVNVTVWLCRAAKENISTLGSRTSSVYGSHLVLVWNPCLLYARSSNVQVRNKNTVSA